MVDGQVHLFKNGRRLETEMFPEFPVPISSFDREIISKLVKADYGHLEITHSTDIPDMEVRQSKR